MGFIKYIVLYIPSHSWPTFGRVSNEIITILVFLVVVVVVVFLGWAGNDLL